MSHYHHAEENPKVSSTAAFFFILIIAGLVLAGINFIKSMSAGHHDDAHHGDAHHATAHADPHSWHHPNQYNTAEMRGAAPSGQTHGSEAINVKVDSAHLQAASEVGQMKGSMAADTVNKTQAAHK